ncbi:methyltransferase domain-containing protein [uncultured Litoreibacter sp.]|uniref:class I SAM-dependent DNA methyltransferase n=1 Tax=uncultured Litoreibacter sp. TaxID=1392394 RepID=UPI0026288718|nr:methyltransferase domain-containing protein [uncultured Litoreibacter sp.]
MSKGFLKNTYGLDSVEKTMEHYSQWSASYDAEVSENGYALPGRIANAVASVTADKGAPVLDFGCGTGLSGTALKLIGFEVIDGMDVSAAMLAQARLKNAYRTLTHADATQPPPFHIGEYGLVTACGVIGSGAAPIKVLDDLTTKLASGNRLAFSFNDNTLADPTYPARVQHYHQNGFALIFEEYGEHLPGIDLKSTVYIIEKT